MEGLALQFALMDVIDHLILEILEIQTELTCN
jgi:hypothetical protein